MIDFLGCILFVIIWTVVGLFVGFSARIIAEAIYRACK